MTTCIGCGKALPPQSSVFERYTPRGLAWLVIVVVTVGGMAVALALGTLESLLETELSNDLKLLLIAVFCAIMAVAMLISLAKVLRTRRLARYCSDCVAALLVKDSANDGEYGAHKIRLKKE